MHLPHLKPIAPVAANSPHPYKGSAKAADWARVAALSDEDGRREKSRYPADHAAPPDSEDSPAPPPFSMEAELSAGMLEPAAEAVLAHLMEYDLETAAAAAPEADAAAQEALEQYEEFAADTP